MEKEKRYVFPIAATEAAHRFCGDFAPRDVIRAGTGRAAALVVTAAEADFWRGKCGGVPLFIAEECGAGLREAVLSVARSYELSLLPPFTRALVSHTEEPLDYFATPGHHAGALFAETDAGRVFTKAFGEDFFALDLSDSDDAVGDVTSHEGSGGEAEALAARVWHADRTYFILGGTSAANRIAASALLAKDDVVLFDRNNHKSVYQGALVRCGARPVYLDTVRNEAGVIGGISFASLDEEMLRRELSRIAPEKAARPRPFRLACLQLVTYDGIFVNAGEVLSRIGHLCDYILFDAAWAGYEPFIPWLRDASPLTLPLGPDSPGLLVAESVHKQLAGFSQTSQLHRKDAHVPALRRVSDEAFQDAFLGEISTSPALPLFAGLEMNAKIHEEKGEELWEAAMRSGIELRKDILRRCRLIRPFGPREVEGRPWEMYPTEDILSVRNFWEISPDADWHGFSCIGAGEFLLDPCKVLLVLPKEIPAPILAAYLAERRIIAEKSSFRTLLLLSEPTDDAEKRERLLNALCDFEKDYENKSSLAACMPQLVGRADYTAMTLPELAAAQADFLRGHHAGKLLRKLFGKRHFPKVKKNAAAARRAFVRRKTELVPLALARGRIAARLTAAYPPGICAVVPGERWTRTAVRAFELLAEYNERFPGFGADLHGITMEGAVPMCRVLKNKK